MCVQLVGGSSMVSQSKVFGRVPSVVENIEHCLANWIYKHVGLPRYLVRNFVTPLFYVSRDLVL